MEILKINTKNKKSLIQILSAAETRDNKDIIMLQKIAFEAAKEFKSFDEFFNYVKRELLAL